MAQGEPSLSDSVLDPSLSRNSSFSRLNAQAPEFVPNRSPTAASAPPPLYSPPLTPAPFHVPIQVVPPPHVVHHLHHVPVQYHHHHPYYAPGEQEQRPSDELDPHATSSKSHKLSDEATSKILNQVEYYFSDLNLATTDHLMRFISKDPEGFVPISVVASFKKIKALVNNHSQLATVLRNSSKLVVHEDGKKVRRQHPLTQSDMEELQSRIVVAENLPEDHCHQNLMKIFSSAGSVKTIRTCQPQTSNNNSSSASRSAKADGMHFSNKLPEEENSTGVMGVVKDGTISGVLPSTQVFGVHYPGYPSSMSRAIDTLGGTQAIHKAHSSASNSNRLELRFRHDDPYSHPAFGDLRPCNSFLLKISNSKSSGAPVLPPQTDRASVCADIVARVPEAYHFDGMADYQHVIAVHADVARKRKRNRVETEEPHSDRGGLMDIDQEDVMILLPQLFAPKDVPDTLVLRPSGTLSVKRNQEEPVQNQLEMDMEPVLAIDFGITEIPKSTKWEDYIPQDSEQWESQMAVSSLFDERPVWPKDSVTERLLNKGFIFSDHMLRRLLSRVAYYFSRGPFLRFWIKKGFDPRKDPDSRIYQKIDYRVKPPLHGYCEANSANQLKHKWSDLCAFRVFPYKCHTTLQLFELDDDYIQEQIKQAPAQTTCSPETGWFTYNLLENLKYRVQVRFLSVYPKPGAERLLKAASESFKKSKKICNKDNLVRDEMVQQQTNAELRGDADAEEPNNVEDDEDDIEVDNGEEALDTYGEHDPAEDGEISLQPHSYLNMDSISRTHLQELFGSFPSPEAGGDRIQDAYTSDEEYQIYEQDSDGNFSDEN